MTKAVINQQMNKKKVQKFWNVANIDGLNAELTLYGDICSEQPRNWWTGEPLEGQYITPEGFLEDLESIKNAKNIKVKLNSCGGDLYTGIAIHNALKGLSAKIHVIVEGIAASAASIIMCAGDTVTVGVGSLVMIHGVAGMFWDYLTLEDLKKHAKAFDASENAIAEIYSQKTGINIDKLRSMMTKETWMSGRQAVEQGFADELLEDDSTEINFINKNVLMVNGLKFDFTGHNIPQGLIQQNVPNKKAGGNSVNKFQEFLASFTSLINGFVDTANEDEEGKKSASNEDEEEDEEGTKNNADKKCIEDAVMAERNRCKEIDDLPSNVSNEMKNEAKYIKPCNAGELAKRVLQQQNPKNNEALAKIKQDYEVSGSKSVFADNATPDNISEDAKKVTEAKQFVAQRKARKEKK